jgi:hypothetical protein
MTRKTGTGMLWAGLIAGVIALLSRRQVREKGSQFYEGIEANYGKACSKTSTVLHDAKRLGKRYMSYVSGLFPVTR